MIKSTLFMLVSGLFLLMSCSTLDPTNSLQEDQKTLIKSPSDNREYKSLILSNQLKVLLISDPDAEQAAAALSVRVGQFDDPADRQGLAHFLEHMLFLGNKKYPEADSFGHFLASHGGRSNAFTGLEKTTFFFTVNQPYLNDALDQFSQFFIAPTFNAAFVEREVNAVHSEHQKNLKTDERRIYQVTRHTANPNHPFNKFGTGSLETLYGDRRDPAELRSQLVSFFDTKYSANVMGLAVLGEASLEELEMMVRAHFDSIPNKNLTPQTFESIPVLPTPLNRTIHIKPIKSVRQLRFQFPIPPQDSLYLTKPAQLISHLIGDESKGSILASLKSEGWATSLSAGAGLDSASFAIFSVSIGLTEEGDKHIPEITRRLFQYIDLLKNKENLEGYFEELRQIAEIEFKFQEKGEPSMVVSRLASALHEIPPHHILAYPWMYGAYQHEPVRAVLDRLSATNLQLIHVSPSGPFDLEEPWYGTRYRVLEQLDIAAGEDATARYTLALPEPNPFIVSDVELKPLATTSDYPELLKSAPGGRIWYKQDDVFRVPKGNIYVRLSTPVAYTSVKNAALSKLFTLILRDSLNEYSYPAQVAGLNYSVSNSVQGIELMIGGYSENIPKLFNKIAQTVTHLKIDDARFAVIKEKMKEDRQNQKLGQAYRRVNYETFYLLSDPLFHTDEYLNAIDKIEPDDLRKFVPVLLSQTHVEMLAHGNFDRDDIRLFGSALMNRFTEPNKEVSGPRRERTLFIPESTRYVYAFPVEDVNSAIQQYYQLGPQVLTQQVGMAALEKMIEKPFYHQLRTIEQLGYIVWSGYSQLNNVDGFYFIVQSSVKNPSFLQTRIESFLADFRGTLAAMSETDFETYRESLIAERMEKPKNLTEETQRNWRVITSGDFNFDHRQEEIEALKILTLEDVRAIYRTLFFSPQGPKSMSVQATGKSRKNGETEGVKIEDPLTFNQNASFYENIENRQLLDQLEKQAQNGKRD